MWTTVLRWIVAFILGMAGLTVVVLSGFLFSAVGIIMGVISLGTTLLIVIAMVIDEWWQSRK